MLTPHSGLNNDPGLSFKSL